MTRSITNPLKFVSFLCMCAALSSCNNKKDDAGKGGAVGKGRANAITAEVYVVQPTSFADIYTASGSLLPNEEISVLSEISGRVTAINFREGGRVSKGQTLVQLYDADLRAQLDKLRAQRSLQQSTARRAEELVSIGGISRQEFETAETGIRSIEADIAFAEAQLRRTRIVAPFSGTIGLRGISVGAVISPSTVIATLQQTSPLKMDFTVPDQYRNRIQNGSEVMFLVTGIQDTLQGKVAAIDPGADPTTRTIRIRAIVPNDQNRLNAGAFAQVMIPFSQQADAILIPTQSLIPTTRERKVAVVKNGKANLITVQTGQRTADKVLITAGLSPGDTILTTGIMQVKPGMAVKVRKVSI